MVMSVADFELIVPVVVIVVVFFGLVHHRSDDASTLGSLSYCPCGNVHEKI